MIYIKDNSPDEGVIIEDKSNPEKNIYAVVILAPILTYILSISPSLYAYYFDLNIIECSQEKWLCAKSFALSNLYQFGYELLPINGLITFAGLYLSKINPLNEK